MARNLIELLAAVVLFIEIPTAYSSPKRIQSVILDKAEVHDISIAPGLATVMSFPCDVNEAVVGRQEDVKVTISPTSRSELTLHLLSSASGPTNLIVKCGENPDPFVFDLIPSRKNHQDFIKVVSSIGAPRLKLQDSPRYIPPLDEVPPKYQMRDGESLVEYVRRTEKEARKK